MDDIVGQFTKRRDDYAAFGKLLTGFLDAKIAELQGSEARLPLVHSIKPRVKTLDSLKKKLQKWGRLGRLDHNRMQLGEIEDLAGVRIIFYFKDDMEMFVKNDFVALFGKRTKESIDDKRRSLDSFGYGSFHFTVSYALNSMFTDSLREEDRDRFKGLKCEVQVRTILQHAWAETAHDIVYKRASDSNQTTEEQQAERLFNAMAATLELLDDRLVKQKRTPRLDLSPPTISAKEPVGATWLHNDARHFRHNRVPYPYLLLHEGDLDEIACIEDWELYDSSRTFGVVNFKAEVWGQLKAKNRAFVDSLYSYDSTAVRVKAWDAETSTISLQPALYSDQITTNHPNAHMCKLSNGRTVHDYAFREGKLLDLSLSPLANTIGVACVIRTSDNYWILGKRRAGLSVFSERWSCPVSGIVEWRERGQWHPESFREWVTESILLECDQEIGLQTSHAAVNYVGFALEAQRLGKPQIFFFIDLLDKGGSYSASNMEARYKIYRIDNEFSTLAFIEASQVESLMTGKWKEIMKVTKGEPISSEVLTNLALAQRFLLEGSVTRIA